MPVSVTSPADPAAPRRSPRWNPVPGRSARHASATLPVQLVALAVASVLVWILTGDWLAPLALWVLWLGWRILPWYDGPPVLALAFTFQWLQVSMGVYYHGLTGRLLPANYVSETRTMVLLGLGCLLALAAGIGLGGRMSRRGIRSLGQRPTWVMTSQQLVLTYLGATFLQGPLQAFAWQLPLLTQGILALAFARLGLLFLVFRRLTRGRIRWSLIGGILILEMLLGFTGYFAHFREPLIMLALALLEHLDLGRLRHWLLLGGLALVIFVAGLLWMGIRTPYRRDFELDTFAESRTARLERIADLSTDWLGSNAEEWLYDLDRFVDRLWAVYYPALAVRRVPAEIPHTDGQMLWEAVRHILTPRILFPDKAVLPSDSEKVRLYSGVWVAGADQGVSIAFGYAIESYVDFGVPWMFLPVFVWGLVMGALYRFLNRLIWHRELAVGVVTVVFWIALYLFERSWIKTLGTSLTLMIYLGFAVFVVDRLLWEMRRQRRQRLAPATAPFPVGTSPRSGLSGLGGARTPSG